MTAPDALSQRTRPLGDSADAPMSTRAPDTSTSLPPRSVRGAPNRIERIVVVEGAILASFANIFLQIRRGSLSLEAFDGTCSALQRHRTLTPRNKRVGVIALTEGGALIPPEPVRKRQREFMSDLLKQPDVRLAVVVLGDSVTASLLRSASRGVVSGHPRLRLGDRPEPACQWISEELNIDKNELDAALREARAVAERTLAAPP